MARGKATEHEDVVVDRVRIDKWLWAARFYKTRTLAVDAVEAGQVRVSDERVKPARALKIGDVVTIRKDGLSWELTVTGLSDRRGPASEAVKLYSETPESAARRAEIVAQRRAAGPLLPGRPTKRDRRELDRLQDGWTGGDD